MGNIVHQITGLTVPDGGDTAERDEMIMTGVLGCWDFANTFCLDPADTPVNGMAIPNLVVGAPDATLVMASGASVTFVDGGIKFNDTTASKIELDDGTEYLVSDLSDDWLVSCFVELPSGSATQQYIMSKITGAFTAAGMFMTAINNASMTFNAKFSNTAAGSDMSVGSIASPTGVTQLAMARIDGIIRLYKDGLLISTGTSAPTAYTDNGAKLTLGRAGSGSLVANSRWCRAMIANLTDLPIEADEFVHTEWALNSARY